MTVEELLGIDFEERKDQCNKNKKHQKIEWDYDGDNFKKGKCTYCLTPVEFHKEYS